jgi:hypothetical protein
VMWELAGWLTSMFEEPRGRRRLSMTRCAVAAFTVAYTSRLLFLDSLGWPDAWLAFCVLMAIPLGKALDRAPAEAVVDAVTGMFGKGVEHVGSVWSRTSETVRPVEDRGVDFGGDE